jgi:signal transduction histidine kinase
VTSPSVDLLEEIRAALDTVEPLLVGRTVDIELSRVRVLAEPTLFRRVFAECITSALARSEASDAITVRVSRTGKAARIEVINEGGDFEDDDLPEIGAAAQEFRAMGGDIGAAEPSSGVLCWMKLPLEPGASSAADS